MAARWVSMVRGDLFSAANIQVKDSPFPDNCRAWRE